MVRYSAVYDNAIVHFGIGEINWTAGQDDIFAMLTDDTAPTKTNAHYTEVSAQPSPQLANGNGYTTGGKSTGVLVTAALASNVVQFDSADTAWTGATFSTYYALTYHGTLALTSGALVSYHQLGGVQTVASGTLTLQWAATGIFTITVSAQT